MSRITESTARHTVASARRGKSWATVIESHENHGGYFFSSGAMSFFNSALVGVPVIVAKDDRAYFVTSERAPHWDETRYTVRMADLTSTSVDTISEQGEYRTPAEAIAARNFIAGV